MDIFTPELDQRRGNFFALMFFIMAICLLFIYMAMGWVSNHIAQVSTTRKLSRYHVPQLIITI